MEKKAQIHIFNTLGPGMNLTLHCKSKNDDLGVQVLPYNVSFSFHFCPNMFSTTLFFCSFAWTNQFHWFDIYDQNRDVSCGDCTWNVTQGGPCMISDGSSWKRHICYPYNKNLGAPRI
ncbi:hypothetical protein Tsubulata_014284 [Turnera subulata]|uniref:S-protein homolog n=1 Tax=Turnera subulata TaxID=218843 RepID=A0A9Q0FF26_9ROSI|nr:hypothetical protein Tsubulata_014284 [Turnera subulata]